MSNGRFAWRLRRFLSSRISLDEAQQIVRQRLQNRERNFLRMVEGAIFRHARSPYLPLLREAGCEFGDLDRMVRTGGLEGALTALRSAGVYLTFEEFKGRSPIVRNGRVVPVTPADFDNPMLSNYYQAESGGSTGSGTPSRVDLQFLADQAPQQMLAYEALGLLDVPTALWVGILPDGAGVGNILRGIRMGHVPVRWFNLLVPGSPGESRRYRLNTYAILAAARLSGWRVPWPESVSLTQAGVVARWIRETLDASGRCLVRCTPSRALRVCLTAEEAGMDLRGAIFMGGGEPPTRGKVDQITRTGARWVSRYVINEAGHVGAGCANAADPEDVHLLDDALALIQHAREVPAWQQSVDAFHFTSLLPTAPKVLLNVESDDYGIVEDRACGCLLHDCGFTRHLRGIRSFSKIASEGSSIVGSDVIRILEELLPARFGGSALDYQLLEEEDEHGLTRLSVVVSPRVALADEEALIEAVLQALSNTAQTVLRQAGTLRVRRAEPVWTRRGKLIPLHSARGMASSVDQASPPRQP